MLALARAWDDSGWERGKEGHAGSGAGGEWAAGGKHARSGPRSTGSRLRLQLRRARRLRVSLCDHGGGALASWERVTTAATAGPRDVRSPARDAWPAANPQRSTGMDRACREQRLACRPGAPLRLRPGALGGRGGPAGRRARARPRVPTRYVGDAPASAS